MKFSLIRNDKSTAKDELLLLAFILLCIGLGAVLYIAAPSFWIFSSAFARTFGLIWVFVGVMFVPGLIFRLFTNKK